MNELATSIELPEDAECGPEMRRLKAVSPLMARFAIALVEYGCTATEAAARAGYSSASRHSLEATGYRVKSDPRVQAALEELSRGLLKSEGAKSIKTLVAIRDDTRNRARDRLTASVEILNRSGLHAQTQHTISVQDHRTDAELDADVISLAKDIGLGADAVRRIVLDPSRVIDAEFVEITPNAKDLDEQARRDHANELRRERHTMTPRQLEAHKAAQQQVRSERASARYAEIHGQQADLEDAVGAADDIFTVYPEEEADDKT